MTYEQPPNHPSKRCNFLKHALATCHTLCRKISFQSPEQEQEEDDVSDYDDEQEVFVSAVLSRYMEAKSKRKVGLTVDSFIWGFSPSSTHELLPTKKEIPYPSDVEDMDEFYSSCSHLSRCSSATTAEAFMSVKPNLSRCSSTGSFEFPILRRRRSIIRELSHCEGWPFGLCRKALLVPPLPKSPSESWLWRKTTTIIKIP
ncbi:hypothetical protein L6452_06535 [Arctium lappa]|uniref:Uncharacterized protein n=2 Tax=Arctium lappa TaxID=4217 RepID=A0ACB9EJY9_ARCLA|nr:hypothetical protein L6452_06533 [Arctium lappa]KAI3758962.1 hypothetical protein L6452_06535 [Arctium lappa]